MPDQPSSRAEDPPERIFVVSIGSTREIDRVESRMRRLEGINPPTPREGRDLEWRTFLAISPDPPLPSLSLDIVWAIDQFGAAKMTRTSQVVGAFVENPTTGPFAWTGEGDDGASAGFVLVDGESIGCITPAAAHVLASLANVGAQYRGFASPDPLFSIEPLPEGDDIPPGQALLTVGGGTVAVGPSEAVETLYDALRSLPPCAHYAMSVMSASVPGATWSWCSIALVPEAAQWQALRASGLTDEEIASADLQAIVDAACEVEELLGSWGAVGRWLRAPHPAIARLSPLEALMKGEDVGPALDDPYAGGDPSATTWESEAISCWRAATKRWTWVELRRDRRDGRWLVVGSRRGVRIAIYDSLYGLTAASQTGENDAATDGFLPLKPPIDAAAAPLRLARRVDRWLKQPGKPELALARALLRTEARPPG